jgi:arsenate reductase (thioredoxin)
MRRTIRERNILFLDEENACLSQMAEAVAKHLHPPKIRVFSAGVKPTSIPPQVHKVMEEMGISLSGQASKRTNDIPLGEIDLVVSFNDADKKCETLPARAKIARWPIADSEHSAAEAAPSLNRYRLHRDEIDKRVFALFMDYWRNIAE